MIVPFVFAVFFAVIVPIAVVTSPKEKVNDKTFVQKCVAKCGTNFTVNQKNDDAGMTSQCACGKK